MAFLKKSKIKWDLELIKELMKVAGVCEESIKDNIKLLCVVIISSKK